MSETITYEVRVRGIDEDFCEHVCTGDYRVADEAFTELLRKVSHGGGAVQIVAIFHESRVEAVMASYVRHPVNLEETTCPPNPTTAYSPSTPYHDCFSYHTSADCRRNAGGWVLGVCGHCYRSYFPAYILGYLYSLVATSSVGSYTGALNGYQSMTRMMLVSLFS